MAVRRFSRITKSNSQASPGKRLWAALKLERPLQVAGVIHSYAAILAEAAGFKALYLSGAGVANASYGVPDIGITTLEDVLIDVRRITAATRLPLLVDADTGWNDPRKAVREMVRAGAAGVHIEDQVETKRCGHLANKRLVSTSEMTARIRAAVRGRTADPSFVIMARTDAVASEGMEKALARAVAYRDAGADMIFAEALTDLAQYRSFARTLEIPILANITEFGKTPLFTSRQLASAGVSLALYPLSAFRAMNAAALKVFSTLRKHGTQKRVLSEMQTRAELYAFLGYDPKTGKWNSKGDYDER
ncbi:MAG TPA: methylisocitrate lyase [Verrucomicrobiae bacterium]|nr:methylisocitrate lyase [Verrucomicrobiae bacterium]